MKKFEEGIFSDLRNLKPGVDASLEEPKVSFFSLMASRRDKQSCVASGGKGLRKKGEGTNLLYILYVLLPSLGYPHKTLCRNYVLFQVEKKKKKLCLRHWPSLLLRLLLYPSFYSFSFPLFFLLSSFFSLARENK